MAGEMTDKMASMSTKDSMTDKNNPIIEKPSSTQTEPTSVKILLAGSSGIPGRNILTSLLSLQQSEKKLLNIEVSVIKRAKVKQFSESGQESQAYSVVYVDDFSNTPALAHVIESQEPDIVISALNAEPEPSLDNDLLNAIVGSATLGAERAKKPVFFINGFTLDLLHPSVSASLPPPMLQKLAGKMNFAKRLHALSHSGEIQYCTIVCAAFLDYCLVRGYLGVNLESDSITLVDGGDFILTGCSLRFVGDAVAQVVRQYVLGSASEKSQIVNERLRIAETRYSGQLLLATVEQVTGKKLATTQKTSAELLEAGSVIGFLNWSENGASTFVLDGLSFGHGSMLDDKRRNLEDIVQTAIKDGTEVFEGMGR